MPVEPASPCTKLCKIAPHTGLCLGCARTLDEIARWRDMKAAEKYKVLADLSERRRTAPGSADL